MRRTKEMRTGSPVYPTRVSTEGIDTRKNLVESAFITIRAGLMQFSMLRSELMPANPPTLDKLPRVVLGKGYEQMGIYVASDGFALHKLTKNGLTDYAHHLNVPTKGGDPEYRRVAFNVDPQCVSTGTVQLIGITAISRNPDAVVELLAFERDIVYESLEHADPQIS